MAVKRGSNGRNSLSGTKGNDKLSGLGGNDFLSGGSGGDLIYGGSGNDRINGGSGNDRIYGGSGDDRIAGNSGNDRISGGTGDDRMNGGSGDDRLYGGAGDNRLYGDSGDDILDGGGSADVYGGAGNDTLSRSYRFFGDDGNDTLNGSSSSEEFYGGAGDDIIYGGAEFAIVGIEVNILSDGPGADQVFGAFTTGLSIDSFRAFPDSTPDLFDGRGGSNVISYVGDPTNPNVGVEVYINAPGTNTGVAAGDVYININGIDGQGGADDITMGGGGFARGGGGNDVLQSHGNDGLRETLIGDGGNDTLQAQDFNGDGINYRLQLGLGDDTINGFKRSVGDVLQVVFNTSDIGRFPVSSLVLVNQTDNIATTGVFQFIFETDTDILWFDIDGNGSQAVEKIATLTDFFANWGNMQTTDFQVII